INECGGNGYYLERSSHKCTPMGRVKAFILHVYKCRSKLSQISMSDLGFSGSHAPASLPLS
ncbi:MAG: hypothetical protein NTX45_12980, partial [Proteobacteria bacterium]|nr:hypothetical protein [Pseudomonadota bacterium]